jgi:hypothetical protein
LSAVEGRISGAADHVDLTPDSGLPLFGFVDRTGPSEGVADSLEANAIALRDAAGRTAVIVVFDTLFVGPAVDAELRAFLRDDHGVRDEDILLLASHSHYAPALDPTKPMAGTVDSAYLASVIERSKAMLRRLLDRPMVPLKLTHASAPWQGSVHRRKRWPLPYLSGSPRRLGFHGPAMAPEPRGPSDDSVRSWLLQSEDGAPLAVLWHCACHPTGFPRRRQVSSEFPGRVREAVRNRIAPGLPVVFLQGFAGDVRQRSPETRTALRGFRDTLLWGPSFCPFDEAGWLHWTQELSSAVESTLTAAGQRAPVPLTGVIRSAGSELDLAELVDGDNGRRSIRCRRVRVGDELDLWAVAAEPSMALRDFLPGGDSTVALGYLGDVSGYWPTATQVAEGGYEARGFVAGMSLNGRMRPSVDEAFQAMVKQLEVIDDD